MRPHLLGTTLAALALLVSGCGGGGEDDAKGADPSASSTPSPTSPSPTGTGSSSAGAVSGTGGSILLVPADSPTGGRCTPAPRQGVVCSADRGTTYRFQPGAVRRVGVRSATGEDDPANGWQVRVGTTGAGRAVLTRLTRQAAGTGQVLLVLTPDRRLVTAPQVSAPITGGELQISGSLSQAQARRLVRQITSQPG